MSKTRTRKKQLATQSVSLEQPNIVMYFLLAEQIDNLFRDVLHSFVLVVGEFNPDFVKCHVLHVFPKQIVLERDRLCHMFPLIWTSLSNNFLS